MWEYKTVTLPRSTFAADKLDPTTFNAERAAVAGAGYSP